VFSDLSIPTSGTYDLIASGAALTQTTTDPVIITNVPARIAVAGKQLAPITIDSSTPFGRSVTHAKSLMIEVESLSSDGSTMLKRSVPVRNGRVVIKNLNVHKAGDYTLVVSDAQGNTMSQTFTILPAAPVRLVFSSQPIFENGHASFSLKVVDRYGNLTSALDGNPVNLRLNPISATGRQLTLGGTVIASVVAGTATFQDVSIANVGLDRLIATAATLRSAQSDVFEIA
jgi:hypothetical protein